MSPTLKYYTILILTTAAYFGISKLLFDKVNESVEIVIDEDCHLPQGKLYCNGNFTHWDSRITTLPGLYLVTAPIGNYFECSSYNLRFANLIASTVNLLLFASILKYVYFNVRSPTKIVLQALNLVLLPPLYFFSHLYYTDTLSLTFLLLFSRISFTNKHNFMMLFLGLSAIMMRQTNVVWIAMVFGHKFLDTFIKSSRVFGNQYITNVKLSKHSLIAKDVDSSKLRRYYNLIDVYYAVNYHLSTCMTTFFRFLNVNDCLTMITQMIILSCFGVFYYYNGSLVVGDKKAHTPTIHLPQLLYFLVFYGFFGLPYVVSKLKSTLKLMYAKKYLVLITGIVFGVMVHYNTQVHPYLLADNRHFMFYIWNRWYGKYDFAIYASVPAYIFLLFSLYDNLKDQNCISFLLPYTVCLVLVVALQKLLEIRYFLIPYIILRLRFGKPSYNIVVAEFLWYLLINVGAFNVFFSRAIYWKDFDYVQRIIW